MTFEVGQKLYELAHVQESRADRYGARVVSREWVTLAIVIDEKQGDENGEPNAILVLRATAVYHSVEAWRMRICLRGSQWQTEPHEGYDVEPCEAPTEGGAR